MTTIIDAETGEVLGENILPPLATADYQSLKSSIARDGQRIPVIIDADTGEIIDGAHRLRACAELGINPIIETQQYATPHDAERARVLLNVSRRNMTGDQRRALVAELNRRDWSQQEIAEALGVARTTITGDISIVKSDNAYINDRRTKLTPTDKAEIVERVLAGETQAQVAADKGVEQPRVSQILKQAAEKERQDAERRALAEAMIEDCDLPPNVAIWEGDFREAGRDIPDDSVSLIFTDPPYDEEAIALYGDLAQLAARVLAPGGSLLCYAGHYALPQIFELMMPHLRFWWVISVGHAESRRLPGKWVVAAWKPMLWFVKERRANNNYLRDAFSPMGAEKALHDWQQPVAEATYCIETLTEPGDLILDPMAGSGTTLIAALQTGRRALGIEANPETVNIMRGRVSEHDYSAG